MLTNFTFKFYKKYINYILVFLGILFVHSTILDLIAIQEITPDLFIILVVWIALKEETVFSLLAAFTVGLFFDLVSADIIGTNALSKTVAAFVASFFYKETEKYKITKNYRFILIVALAAFVHNLIYYFFYIKTSEQNFMIFYLRYGVASAVYTTFFAALLFLFQIPSNRIKM